MKKSSTKHTRRLAGPDLSLLKINASKSLAERVEAHDRALKTALALREAVRKATRA